jgi:cell division protein FtsB
MTKDELRQEIEQLKAKVKRLEALVAIGNGRVNMLRASEYPQLGARSEYKVSTTDG